MKKRKLTNKSTVMAASQITFSINAIFRDVYYYEYTLNTT